MKKIVLASLALLFSSQANSGLLGDEECNEDPLFDPVITGCVPGPGEEDPGTLLPPPDPPASDTPPEITPVSELATLESALAETEILVDWYLQQVFENQGVTQVSIDAIEPQLQAFADSQVSSQPSYYSIIPAEQRVLNVKIRILVANHPEFTSGASLPPDFVALVEHAAMLELLEGGLIEVAP